MHPIRRLDVSVHEVPTATDQESDGTIIWTKTTLLLVQIEAGGHTGIGYSYADPSAGNLIHGTLKKEVIGDDAMDIPHLWQKMIRSVRNIGRPGIASTAISAVDNALWDLKARILGLSLAKLLGQARDEIAIYGSGGFTSYSVPELQSQLGGWVSQGISKVKMKVGRDPDADVERVSRAREAIGPDAELFVDANGAYARKQALSMADAFSRQGVSWFEEPVSSDDLEGLRLLRDRAPAGMRIAAGEYGYDTVYFRRMVENGAVDVLQIDATRCLGVSGFLQAAGVAAGWNLPVSAHTAPSLHSHLCCAIPAALNLEYFFDHDRIERMFFEGTLEPRDGKLRPDASRTGIGLELKRSELRKYAA